MITFSRLGSHGRLGNQMFQIASTIGIAVKNQTEFGFPTFDNQVYFKNRLPYFNGRLPRFDVGWGFSDIYADNVDLLGYLQSELYFEHCKGIVKYYLTLEMEIEEHQGVAVHIRRGDYDGVYHTILDQVYYEPAIAIMQSIGYKKFTFFSDSPEQIKWAKQYGEIVDKGNEMADMCHFAGHEAYIIGNSTWSWWGAWLGDPYEEKMTIAPVDWFGAKANLNTLDLIPARWMLI